MLKNEVKFLELWEKPDDSGEAIGCLSTSFTFDSGEFEEECLARFLQLSADGKDEKIIQVLELETSLQQSGSVTAFIDAHHATGKRSPRWTIAPVQVPGAVFHPKVQLLVWSKWVRIIIGSANLSLSGLRYNTELAVSFDFAEGLPASLDFAIDVIKFFKKINKEAKISDLSKEGVLLLLDRVEALVKNFELEKPEVPYHFVPTIPNGTSVYEQILDIKKHNIFDKAFIESPSFDLPETKNEAAEQIWDLLRKNGEATVTYNLQGREDKKLDIYELIAPESLTSVTGKKQNIKFRMYEAKNSDKGDFHGRMLHSKCIALVGEKKSLLLVGSSNFSTLGLGLLKKRSNYEANVVFMLDSGKPFDKLLQQILLPSDEIDITKASWLPEKTVDQIDQTLKIPFPNFIKFITFSSKDNYSCYLIHLNEDAPDFNVLDPSGQSLKAISKNVNNTLSLEVEHIVPHSDLKIEWNSFSFLYPVNIDSQDSIPAPNYLRNLSLEEIVNLLSSNLPLQKALQRFLRKQVDDGIKLEVSVDPHDKVDTSKFLLKRTRQFGWAISALKRQIENSPTSIEQLRWRLTGPLGVFAVKDAVLRFFSNPDEKTFFLAEIIGELYRLNVLPTKTLKKNEINDEINKVIFELKSELNEIRNNASILVQTYIATLEANYARK